MCRNSIPLLMAALYLSIQLTGYLLRWLNLRHLRDHGAEVPQGFELAIDGASLARTSAYTAAQNGASLLQSLVDNAILLMFLFSGALAWYDRLIASITGSPIAGGVLFFLGLILMQTVIDLPFGLHDTFRIENRFGFNTTTPWLWCTDFLKSTAIETALATILAAGGFYLVGFSPQHWWLWVWIFFAGITIFLMYLSPYVIEPLFYTFQPVREEGLEEEIRNLMSRAGLKVDKVLVMDASRRSRHSNAYFTGIGRVKRIVLYDTLLRQMSHQEILAVLAHEVGHWKGGHIVKRLLTTELTALGGTYLAYRLITWGGVPGLIGMEEGLSLAGQLIILGFLASMVTFPLTPLQSWISRRQERQADDFATALTGTPEALASALIKLSAENLANLHPHPLYAGFYYSHPPVAARVRRLLGNGSRECSRPRGESRVDNGADFG